MAADIYITDYGVPLKITIKVGGVPQDISNATSKVISFMRPDGTTVTKNMSFDTDGTNGVLAYTIEQGLLTVPGEWLYQVYVTTASSGRHTEHGTLTVGNNL